MGRYSRASQPEAIRPYSNHKLIELQVTVVPALRWGEDHDRLINKLRIMREPVREEAETDEEATEPVLGCERGGLQSAEQLLLARYFMFSQVYHHPTRLAYNEHLKGTTRHGA